MINFSTELQKRLVCPVTGEPLHLIGDHLESTGTPALKYPITDGIPIVINDANSLFAIDDFVAERDTTTELNENALKKALKKIVPSISISIKSKQNYRHIAQLLPHPAKILVVGGRIRGAGMEPLYTKPEFEVIGADVSYGPATNIICDGHDIPFADNTFDLVIVQAVLEHVLEPHRVVKEIHRVLKSDGLVYAETPFMAQVHGRQFDFTRFTYLGHRWLFKDFCELKSGTACGPAQALAWAYSYFLRSFATSRRTWQLLTAFSYFTAFFLKYLDHYLIDKPGSYDAAFGYYFLGRKQSDPLPIKDLLSYYKGMP